MREDPHHHQFGRRRTDIINIIKRGESDINIPKVSDMSGGEEFSGMWLTSGRFRDIIHRGANVIVDYNMWMRDINTEECGSDIIRGEKNHHKREESGTSTFRDDHQREIRERGPATVTRETSGAESCASWRRRSGRDQSLVGRRGFPCMGHNSAQRGAMTFRERRKVRETSTTSCGERRRQTTGRRTQVGSAGDTDLREEC